MMNSSPSNGVKSFSASCTSSSIVSFESIHSSPIRTLSPESSFLLNSPITNLSFGISSCSFNTQDDDASPQHHQNDFNSSECLFLGDDAAVAEEEQQEQQVLFSSLHEESRLQNHHHSHELESSSLHPVKKFKFQLKKKNFSFHQLGQEEDKENSKNVSNSSVNVSNFHLTKSFRWHSHQLHHHHQHHHNSNSTSPILCSKRAKSVEQTAFLFDESTSIPDVNSTFSKASMLRRTFSTHVNDQEFVQNSSNFTISSSLSLESGERLQLPHFKSGNDAIKRINVETLAHLIEGKYSHLLDEFIIVDCRFQYEYEGGHINNAVNINSMLQVEQFLLSSTFAQNNKSKKAVIFHCEFSSFRAPRMALHVRKNDRLVNANAYPNLLLPEMYILEGGYKQFFSYAPHHCSPQCYIQMEHELFKKESIRLLNEFKYEFSSKKKSKTISNCSSFVDSPLNSTAIASSTTTSKSHQTASSFSQKIFSSFSQSSSSLSSCSSGKSICNAVASSPLSQRQLFNSKVVVLDSLSSHSPSLLLSSDDFAAWEDLCDATNSSKSTILDGSNVFF